MRVLVLGGCGFVGSHLVDELVAEDHEVHVVDDLSSCWLDVGGTKPMFANPGAVYHRTIGCPGQFDVLVNLALRHPVERERAVYQAAFEGFVVQGFRVATNPAYGFHRVVIAGTAETHHRSHVYLTDSLQRALAYWHRPPLFGVYVVHLPELVGARRLPEAELAAGVRQCPVEVGVQVLKDWAVGKRNQKSMDVYVPNHPEVTP